MKRLEISGQLLARNTLLNLIGQAVPLVVGVVTISFIVRSLGTEPFGRRWSSRAFSKSFKDSNEDVIS